MWTGFMYLSRRSCGWTFLFFYGFSKDTLRSLISWNRNEGNNDVWIRKEVKVTGSDLILGTNPAFAWRVWKE
jgi:hypothetical protein